MKKIIAFVTAIITMSSSMYIPVFAENIEENIVNLENTQEKQPRESLYFSSYYYDLEPSNKNGYLDFESLVVTTNQTDKVRVTVQLQQYNDGWEDYGDEYVGTSSKAAYAFEDTVKVDRGEEYRAKFYYEAIVNDKVVETKTFATSGVIAP